MRGAFIAQYNPAGIALFSLGLAFSQDAHKMRQTGKFRVLFGDNLVQFIDQKGHMRDGFFKLGDAIL